MSIGIGAYARKTAENGEAVTYEYGVYNLNIEGVDARKYDGQITVRKTAFVEPEMCSKKKKTKKGRKRLVTKRIKQDLDWKMIFENDLIEIANCSSSFSFEKESGNDQLACRIVDRISDLYQENGSFPDQVYIDY